jgi:arabinofuranosyltransferase
MDQSLNPMRTFRVFLAASLILSLVSFVCWNLVFLSGSSLYAFPLDDAWIHQVYVRGMLHDGLPTYNSGEPEAGYSSLLWILLNLPVMLLVGENPVWLVPAVKALSLLAVVLLLPVLALSARASKGAYTSWVVLGVLALSPYLWFGAHSGMEVSWAALFVALFALRLAASDLRGAGLSLALAALTRPEAASLVVVAIYWVATTSATWRKALLSLVLLLIPSVLLGSLWLALNQYSVGHLLPNTFYVKSAFPNVLDNLRFATVEMLAAQNAGWHVVCLLGFLCGIATMKPLLETETLQRQKLLLLSGITGCASVLISRPFHEGVTFYQERYLFVFLPVFAPLIAIGLTTIGHWMVRRFGRMATWIAIGGVALLGIGAIGQGIDSYGRHCVEITELHVVPGIQLSQVAASTEAVGVEGAGAIAWFSGLRTLDLMGLNNHRIAHAESDIARACEMASFEATWFVLPPGWSDGLQPVYQTELVGQFVTAESGVYRDGRQRFVELYRAEVRPSVRESCLARTLQ